MALGRPDGRSVILAASSAQLGNRIAAAAHAHEVLQRQPTFTV
jgi:hypothetical protein